jgi:hypothetical protein
LVAIALADIAFASDPLQGYHLERGLILKLLFSSLYSTNMGRMPTLLYQRPGTITLRAGTSQTYLGILTDGENIFDTVDFCTGSAKAYSRPDESQ